VRGEDVGSRNSLEAVQTGCASTRGNSLAEVTAAWREIWAPFIVESEFDPGIWQEMNEPEGEQISEGDVKHLVLVEAHWTPASRPLTYDVTETDWLFKLEKSL